jgi:hypothetical protein
MDGGERMILAILPFLTPAIFGMGAAATAIPIAIHLLSRRRFRTVTWAAMDFLLAAQRRNARRLQLQKWILLLLRIAALLLLAAAIAQFFWNNALASSLLGSRQRAIVIVWDDSYSMGYHGAGGPTHFEASRKLLLSWLDTLSPRDEVALFTASTGSRAPIPRLTLDQQAIRHAVQTMPLSDGSTDLAAAITQATQAVSAEPGATEHQIIILTDGTISSVMDPHDPATPRAALREALAAAKAAGTVRLLDFGVAGQGNVGIAALSAERPIAIAGQPAPWRVDVINATAERLSSVAVQCLADDLPLPVVRTGAIDPGGRASVDLLVSFASVGMHRLDARLVSTFDPLPVDDVRRAMVEVRRDLPVLLVDGNPGDRRDTSSVLYIQAALEQDVSQVYAPHVITDLELARTPLTGYGIIALSDVTTPDAATAKALQNFVTAGGVLLIFPGERTIGADYNRVLGPAGVDLLPATFGAPIKLESAQDLGRGLHFDVRNYAHPILQPFAHAAQDATNTGLLTVQTTEYLKLVPTTPAPETVLSYAGDNAATTGDPAVVLTHRGRGAVVQFASTADSRWNGWGPRPSFPEFIDSLLNYALPRGDGAQTLAVNDAIDLPTDLAPAGTWKGPDNTTVQIEASIDPQRGTQRLKSAPLRRAGIYLPPGTPAGAVVVNTDPTEIDARHLAAPQLAAATALSAEQIVTSPTALEPPVAAAPATSASLGRNILPFALLFLIVEALAAWRFSSYR